VPARPSGKGRFIEGKAFESGKGRMKFGAKREIEQSHTAFVHNFECSGEGITQLIFKILVPTSKKTGHVSNTKICYRMS
jgi:hypothetical protein